MRQDFSYYYGNDYADSFKIYLPLIITDRNRVSRLQGVIDTGAGTFTTTAKSLGIYETEQEFTNKYNLKPIMHRGIHNAAIVRYYRYIVDEIQLGEFKLKNFPIHITFNDNVTVTLVGMSFLRLFNLEIRPDYKTISFEVTEELRGRLLHRNDFSNIDRVKIETFIDFGLEEDIGILDANRVHKLSSE